MQTIVSPMESKVCDNPKWPYLPIVGMPTEFEIDAYFCYRLDLIWSMVEEECGMFSLESRKTHDRLGDIFFLSGFWIVDTDDIEPIDRHYLISENLHRDLLE